MSWLNKKGHLENGDEQLNVSVRTAKFIIWSYSYFIYDSWEVYGGHVGTTCGIIHRYNSMVFDGSRKKRKICSPLFDSRKAGNLRFHFALGRYSQGISLKKYDLRRVLMY